MSITHARCLWDVTGIMVWNGGHMTLAVLCVLVAKIRCQTILAEVTTTSSRNCPVFASGYCNAAADLPGFPSYGSFCPHSPSLLRVSAGAKCMVVWVTDFVEGIHSFCGSHFAVCTISNVVHPCVQMGEGISNWCTSLNEKHRTHVCFLKIIPDLRHSHGELSMHTIGVHWSTDNAFSNCAHAKWVTDGSRSGIFKATNSKL